MIVYILTERYNDYDEDTNILGVFSTEELVFEQIRQMSKKRRKNHTHEIEKFELDNSEQV